MEKTNLPDNKCIYTYQGNKMIVNRELANDLILNENFKKKASLILDLDSNVRDLYKKQEYIGNNDQENGIINRTIVENICIPLLHKTYQSLENYDVDERSKTQLVICKNNAKNYVNDSLKKDKIIDNKRLRNIAKVCRGETFLFSTEDKIDYVFELEKSNKKIPEISQIKKGDLFFRPHIEDGSDLTLMIDKLHQFKFFISVYKPNNQIRYGVYSSRLIDRKFMDYRKNRRRKNNITKSSKIIDTSEMLEKYSAENGILANCPIEEDYKEFKDHFINPNLKNSLSEALKDYELEGNKLEEGGMVLDLGKIKNPSPQEESL